MKGEDISSLQKRLEELEYYHGPIDGIYGRLTERAVKDFQREYQLKEDGIVDREFWDTLANLNDLLIVSQAGKNQLER